MWRWTLWLSLAVTFVFVALSSFAPDKRLWGVNHLAFYSSGFRWVVLAVTAAFFIPGLSRYVWSMILRFFDRISRSLSSGAHAMAFISVVSFVMFAGLRSSTMLLGDGYYLINNFKRASDLGFEFLDYLGKVTVQERIYPATELLNFSFSRAAANIGAVSHASGVWILSCLIGAAFVAVVLVVLKRSAAPAHLKMTVAALMVCTGAIALFFGYIENYTPVLVLGAAFVLTSYRALTAGGSLLLPCGILAAAVLFHVEAILLGPALVFLVLWRVYLKSRPSKIPPAVALLLVLTAAIAVAVGRTDIFRHFFLTPVGTGGSYGVFSGAHLLDILNQITLICPLWPFLAALSIRATTSRSHATEGRNSGEAAFGWCLLGPALLFLLLFNPELGMARDWDLYAFTVLGLAAPGLFALKRLWPGIEERDEPGLLLPPALAVGLLVTFTWIGVNASPAMAVERYKSILTYDQTNPGYAYENLSRYYEDSFNFTGQINALKKAYEATPNPRYLAKLGTIHHTLNQLPQASRYLRAALAGQPDNDNVRKLLAKILAKQGAVDELLTLCQEGIARSPDVPDFHFFLGQAYLQKGNIEEGFRAFETCSTLDPSPAMRKDMTRIINSTLEKQKETDER